MEPKALEPGAGLGAVGEQPKNANLAKGPAVLAPQKGKKREKTKGSALVLNGWGKQCAPRVPGWVS